MKVYAFLIALVFASSASAAGKIDFNAMIDKGMGSQKSLDKNMQALIDAAHTQNDEKKVLEFIQAEIEFGNQDSKIAKKQKEKDQKTKKVIKY